MPKHDKAQQEKRARNAVYALKYRQLVCRDCGHRSSRKGGCIKCGAKPERRRRK